MDNNLTEQVKSYFDDKPEVVAVYVFGSYAANSQKPFSDLDIGVLLDQQVKADASKLLVKYMTDLSYITLKDVHPVILNHASEGLIKQIFINGRCVLIKDRKKLAVFRMVMTARIADFGYHHKMMQAGFLKNLMKGT